MPNYKPNTTGLSSGTQPKWNHTPTKVIRVPECFADSLTEIAKQMDDRACQTYNGCTEDIELDKAIEILTKALTLKANAGGAIKNSIKAALELLGQK